MTPPGEFTGVANESPHQDAGSRWLTLEAVADVNIIVDGERVPRMPGLWTGNVSGEQLIEVRFHHPTSVRRLRLVSFETEQSRTQEITVWVSSGRGERHRELRRQQFNFSPQGATREVEDYELQVDDVSSIQVRVVPSIDGRPAVARVSELQISST